MKDIENLCMGCMNEKSGNGNCPTCGFDPAAPQSPLFLAAGTVLFGRYIVGAPMDNNGEGVTYIGYDQLNDIVVRIREFFPVGLCERAKNGEVLVNAGSESYFTEGVGKFFDLSKQLYRLKDLPCLLPVVDIREEYNTAYCISRNVVSITLREFLLRNGGTLKWEQARPLFAPLIPALHSLHESGIIHRGLSPDTLLVGKDGKIRISGFCIPEARTARSFMTAQLFPGYAAIEQYGVVGSEGTWTDVYGFTATLYRTLVGNPAPEATERVNNDEMTIPSTVAKSLPTNILEALANALQILPEDRTMTMEELREDLATNPSGQREFDPKEKSRKEKSDLPPAPIKNNGKKPGNKKYGLIAAVCTGVFLLVIFVSLYAMIAKKSAAENASRNPLEPMSSASSTAPVVDTGDPLVKYYSLPDFKGSTFAQISRNVDYEGMYEFSIDKKIYDKTQSAGRVISQSPAPGEKVLKGTQVVLTISLGAYEIGIPNVINKTEEQAKFELMKAGFSYQNIEVLQRYDETQTPGVVIEISPNAGKRVNSDAGITIYINSYVAPESSHSSSSSSQSFPWRN